jgi:hypothetical protein
VALAILADACAFLVWNLASRSPAALARDLTSGLTRPAVAANGAARFAGGLFLLAAGAVLLFPLTLETRTFAVLETWTVLTGLLVEQLIGSDRRTRRG